MDKPVESDASYDSLAVQEEIVCLPYMLLVSYLFEEKIGME